ncbi:hypothetical protein EV359DRAFT_87660 [Lentinula novae-zelandiae]|nr:hypothetical protein EV359DRAFT_87660 [Lentinula novae-zelandiae]
MPDTACETWYDYEYHRGMYTQALEQFERRPHNSNAAYELVWAHAVADARPIPPEAQPLAAFPLECLDLLLLLPAGALSSLPSKAVAMAIGWTPALLQKFALEREHPVLIFDEGNSETGTRVVVYFGDDQWVPIVFSRRHTLTGHTRFFSFPALIRAITFLYEFWHSEPIRDQCDSGYFGARWLRDNLIREYGRGADHWEGIEQGWTWLENV